MLSCLVIDFRGWPRLYDIEMPQAHLRGNVAWPPTEFYNHLAGTNPISRDDATAPSVTH